MDNEKTKTQLEIAAERNMDALVSVGKDFIGTAVMAGILYLINKKGKK